MPRIRTIKPELWTDPEFVECSPNARLLFVAGLNFASDYGVLLDSHRQLKMQCFPGDAIDVAPLIDELVRHRMWVRTTAPNGDNVLVVRTFTSHQRVDKPNEGKWGDPSDWIAFPERSTNDPGTIDDASPPEGKGKEGREERIIADDGFASFWEQYPRKVDRKKAHSAWRRLKVGERADALDAIPKHCAKWKADKTEMQFIPYGASWLNAKRWEDDLKAPSAPVGQIVNGHRESPFMNRYQ